MRDLEPAEPIRRYERPASSSTSIPRRSAASSVSDIASPAIAGGKATGAPASAAAPDGSTFMSASTTPRASPSARSCPTRRQVAPSAYSKPPSPPTRSLGIKVERVMTDNGSCYKACDFRDACPQLGLRHTRTSRTRPRPTARTSDSFKRRSASGRTPSPIPLPITAPPNSRSGRIAKTGIAHMAVSTPIPQSVACASPITTCRDSTNYLVASGYAPDQMHDAL